MKFTIEITGRKFSFELGGGSGFPVVFKKHMTVGQWEAFRKLESALNQVYAHDIITQKHYENCLRMLAAKAERAADLHEMCRG